LSNSSIQNIDYTIHFDKLYHSVYCRKRQQQPHDNQSPLNGENAVLNGHANVHYNGKHTRTPSSGCPATPNEDQDNFTDGPSQPVNHEMFDIDGQVLLRDKVQIRLESIMAQYKVRMLLYLLQITK
jgi:hypothetical protein